ncbi:MAG TPA: peptidylprolyl isomerase [Dehalococcoidia bacterium]|nr:peptidylprolyl isomerase [Dehalococcoidia bacterium]
MLYGGVGLLLVIVAGVIAFGYWNAVIRPRYRTVLEANGIKISYDAMRRRMGYEYQQSTQYQQTPTALPEGTYSTLLNEITLVTRAEKDLGVTLTDAEYQQQLRARIGVAANADNRAFADALKKQLDSSGLTETEYRRMVRAAALQSKIIQKFTAELPAKVMQAKFDVILTATQDDANKALARVKAGEDWGGVAKQVSKESTATTTGGLHDYTPVDLIDPTYQSFVSTAKPGDISQVLASSGSTPQYFIIRLLDRSEQPVKDTDKSSLADKKFSDWLSSTEQTMTVFRDWNTQAQSDALVWVGNNIAPKVQAQKVAQQATQVAATNAAATARALLPTPGTATAATAVATPGTAAAKPSPAATATAAATSGGSSPSVPNQPVAPGNGQ